jgi:single-stranded DNA-specific DHH superfamily exonuclease
MSEGYGLNKPAIKQIAESGTRLIVTVDNGISAVEEAEYIYSLGMQLVVTDHHQLGEVLLWLRRSLILIARIMSSNFTIYAALA